MSLTATPDSALRYTTPDAGALKISGWLVKEGKTLKKHAPRFLRLHGAQLSNYKEENGSPTWSVSVIDREVGPGPRKNEIVVHLHKRRVSFFAESVADFRRWIYALKKGSSSTAKVTTFYRLGDVIGTGVNGDVLLGWDKVTNESVAIKTIPYDGNLMQKNDPEAEEEILIVKSLQHPHLVKTYDVFRDIQEQKIYIVMEYVAGGELFQRVVSDRGNLIKEGDAVRIARNIFSAVLYLHERQIVHRDIKPENVLCVDPDEQKPVHVKLADFGLSSKLSGQDGCLSSHVGTVYYIAPEIIKKQKYGASVDLWACGVLIYIILSGEFPFSGENEDEYYANVLNEDVEFPGEQWILVNEDAKDLIRGLLAKEPKNRLTAKEALDHKWLHESVVQDFAIDAVDDEDEEVYAPPPSIFGGRRKTPAQILAKVRATKQKTGT